MDTITLANGIIINLVQQPYMHSLCNVPDGWVAAGYLSTEDPDDETGPTVQVRWDSLGGSDDGSDDADWDRPVSAQHYSRGELLA